MTDFFASKKVFLLCIRGFGIMLLQWVGVFLSLLSPSAPRPTFFLCNGELPSYEDCDVGAIVVEPGRSCFAMRVLRRNLGGGEDQCLGVELEVRVPAEEVGYKLVVLGLLDTTGAVTDMITFWILRCYDSEFCGTFLKEDLREIRMSCTIPQAGLVI